MSSAAMDAEKLCSQMFDTVPLSINISSVFCGRQGCSCKNNHFNTKYILFYLFIFLLILFFFKN